MISNGFLAVLANLAFSHNLLLLLFFLWRLFAFLALDQKFTLTRGGVCLVGYVVKMFGVVFVGCTFN